MADNKTIHYIPPLPPKREKRVGIYCRVSTNSTDQLKSDTKGRVIDLHIFKINEQGCIVFEGEAYPPSVFSGIGKIGDKVVSCIDAENQVLFHLGYEHDEKDVHDVKLLWEKFDIPVPKEYK